MQERIKIIFIFLKKNARNSLLIALIILNCMLLLHIKTMSDRILELRDVIDKIDCKDDDKIDIDLDYYTKEKDDREFKDK